MRGPALLLEGSWPSETPGCLNWSLDDAIDGRFQWIDILASDLAEELSSLAQADGHSASSASLYSSADINALALRYHLVKLARIVAYFTEVRPLAAGDELEVFLSAGRDEDLADLFEELAATSDATCSLRWDEPGNAGGGGRENLAGSFPKNSRLRRLGGRFARLVEPRKDIGSHRQRVVLCGNPRTLDPVAAELLSEGCQLWWLYDRFAVQSWLRWRTRGVGQLFCDSSLGRKNRLTAHLPERLSCLGVNLAPALGRWMAGRLQMHGRRQTRVVREINAHFRRVCPTPNRLERRRHPAGPRGRYRGPTPRGDEFRCATRRALLSFRFRAAGCRPSFGMGPDVQGPACGLGDFAQPGACYRLAATRTYRPTAAADRRR